MSGDPAADERDRVLRLRRLETVLGNLLRCGVTVSVVFLGAGIVLTLVRHPNYLTDPDALAHLTRPGAVFPHTLRDVGRELLELRGRAVMTAGLLLLILTPVSRVLASIVAFALERNWRFVVITGFVFVVLVVSFFLGRVE